MIGVATAAAAVASGAIATTAWLTFNAETSDNSLWNDLAGASQAIRCAYQMKGEAPENLGDVATTIQLGIVPRDYGPCFEYTWTRVWADFAWLRNERWYDLSNLGSIEYARIDKNHIELCATFKTSFRGEAPANGYPPGVDRQILRPRVMSGRHCYPYDLTVPMDYGDRFSASF